MTGEPAAEAGDTELTLLRAQNQQLETRLREALGERGSAAHSC